MSITFAVTLSKAQAEAVLRSDGLTNGGGVRKSIALIEGERRIMNALEDAWNDSELT